MFRDRVYRWVYAEAQPRTRVIGQIHANPVLERWHPRLAYGAGEIVDADIATLVERRLRFVVLVKLSEKGTEAVVDALIKAVRKLPTALLKSLTCDLDTQGRRQLP